MFKQLLMSCGTTINPRIQDQVKSFRALGLIPFYTGLFCTALLLFLTSCAPKQAVSIQSRKRETTQILTDEERARLHDIAFPEDVRPEKLVSQSGQTILTYISKSSVQELFDFYRTDMEYIGWDLVTAFKADESCLIFEKPAKRCIVTTRSDEMAGQTRVILFIGPRKQIAV